MPASKDFIFLGLKNKPYKNNVLYAVLNIYAVSKALPTTEVKSKDFNPGLIISGPKIKNNIGSEITKK